MVLDGTYDPVVAGRRIPSIAEGDANLIGYDAGEFGAHWKVNFAAGTRTDDENCASFEHRSPGLMLLDSCDSQAPSASKSTTRERAART
ncbi:hypothetical protein RHECNPAF_2270010 [Rhizobium etli CNPAF512]|nr:hypothetical protein RHECNPAF_2270010 [Rhizobium etli CNPAF512]